MDYLQPTPRAVDTAAGLGLVVVDLLFVAAIVVLTHRVWSGKALPGAIWVLVVLTLLALAAGTLAWRLLTGRRRDRDGGLLSPFFLRCASMIFVIGSVISASIFPLAVFEIVTAIAAAGACLTLARYREHRANRVDTPIEPL